MKKATKKLLAVMLSLSIVLGNVTIAFAEEDTAYTDQQGQTGTETVKEGEQPSQDVSQIPDDTAKEVLPSESEQQPQKTQQETQGTDNQDVIATPNSARQGVQQENGASPASIQTETDIHAGDTLTAVIGEAGQTAVYKFVPENDGYYRFYSDQDEVQGYIDTKAVLYKDAYDGTGTELASNDEDGGNNQFAITYHCTAGTTYYLVTQLYDSSLTGTYKVALSEMQIISEKLLGIPDSKQVYNDYQQFTFAEMKRNVLSNMRIQTTYSDDSQTTIYYDYQNEWSAYGYDCLIYNASDVPMDGTDSYEIGNFYIKVKKGENIIETIPFEINYRNKLSAYTLTVNNPITVTEGINTAYISFASTGGVYEFATSDVSGNCSIYDSNDQYVGGIGSDNTGKQKVYLARGTYYIESRGSTEDEYTFSVAETSYHKLEVAGKPKKTEFFQGVLYNSFDNLSNNIYGGMTVKLYQDEENYETKYDYQWDSCGVKVTLLYENGTPYPQDQIVENGSYILRIAFGTQTLSDIAVKVREKEIIKEELTGTANSRQVYSDYQQLTFAEVKRNVLGNMRIHITYEDDSQEYAYYDYQNGWSDYGYDCLIYNASDALMAGTNNYTIGSYYIKIKKGENVIGTVPFMIDYRSNLVTYTLSAGQSLTVADGMDTAYLLFAATGGVYEFATSDGYFSIYDSYNQYKGGVDLGTGKLKVYLPKGTYYIESRGGAKAEYTFSVTESAIHKIEIEGEPSKTEFIKNELYNSSDNIMQSVCGNMSVKLYLDETDYITVYNYDWKAQGITAKLLNKSGSPYPENQNVREGTYTFRIVFGDVILRDITIVVKTMDELAGEEVRTDSPVTYPDTVSGVERYTKFICQETGFYRISMDTLNTGVNPTIKVYSAEGYQQNYTTESSLYLNLYGNQTYYFATSFMKNDEIQNGYTLSVERVVVSDISVTESPTEDQLSFSENDISVGNDIISRINPNIKTTVTLTDGSTMEIAGNDSIFHNFYQVMLTDESGNILNSNGGVIPGTYYYVLKYNGNSSYNDYIEVCKLTVHITEETTADLISITPGQKVNVTDTDKKTYYLLNVAEGGAYQFQTDASTSELSIKNEVGTFICSEKYISQTSVILPKGSYVVGVRPEQDSTFCFAKTTVTGLQNNYGPNGDRTYIENVNNNPIDILKDYTNNQRFNVLFQNGYSTYAIPWSRLEQAGAIISIEDDQGVDYSEQAALGRGNYKILVRMGETVFTAGTIRVLSLQTDIDSVKKVELGEEISSEDAIALEIPEDGLYFFDAGGYMSSYGALVDTNGNTTYLPGYSQYFTMELKAGKYVLIRTDTMNPVSNLRIVKFEPTEMTLVKNPVITEEYIEGISSSYLTVFGYSSTYLIHCTIGGKVYDLDTVDTANSNIWKGDYAVHKKLIDEFGEEVENRAYIKAGHYRIQMSIGNKETLECSIEVKSASSVTGGRNLNLAPQPIIGTGTNVYMSFQAGADGYYIFKTDVADEAPNFSLSIYNTEKEQDRYEYHQMAGRPIFLKQGSYMIRASYHSLGNTCTLSAEQADITGMACTVGVTEYTADDIGADNFPVNIMYQALTTASIELLNGKESLGVFKGYDKMRNLADIYFTDEQGNILSDQKPLPTGIYSLNIKNEFVEKTIPVVVGTMEQAFEQAEPISTDTAISVDLKSNKKFTAVESGFYTITKDPNVYVNLYTSDGKFAGHVSSDQKRIFAFLPAGEYYLIASVTNGETAKGSFVLSREETEPLILDVPSTKIVKPGSQKLNTIRVEDTGAYRIKNEATGDSFTYQRIYDENGTVIVQNSDVVFNLESGKQYYCITNFGNMQSIGRIKTTLIKEKDINAVKNLNDSSVTFDDPKEVTVEYAPFAVINDGNKRLQNGIDYTASSDLDQENMTMTVTYTGQGKYCGSVVKTYPITRSPLEEKIFYAIPDQKYTGAPVTPKVEDDGSFMGAFGGGGEQTQNREGIDYKVSYSNNVNIGTATVTITGIGYYTGTVTKHFRIVSQPVEKVILSDSNIAVTIGGTKKLTASVSPANADNTQIRWGSIMPSIADVDQNGNVTGKAEGKTIVVAQSVMDKAIKGMCVVDVKSNKLDKVTLTKLEMTGQNTAELSWNQVAGADGYTVYMSTTEQGTYNWYSTIEGGTKLSAEIKGLKNGQTYYFKVWAWKGNVTGDRIFGEKSDAMNILWGVGTPTLSETKILSSKTARLSWSKVAGADGYTVYESSSKEGTYNWKATIESGDTLSYILSGLKEGSTRYYKVWAWKNLGNGKRIFGEYSETQTLTMALDKVNLKNVLVKGQSAQTISWDKVSNADGYAVYVSTSEADGYKWLATSAGGDTTSCDTTQIMTPGQTYYFKVWAYAGEVGGDRLFGPYSNVKSASYGLGKVQLSDVQIIDSVSMRLNWNQVTGADGYTVYQSDSPTGNFAWLATIDGGNTTSYTVNRLTAGKDYYYKVWAWKGAVGSNRIFGPYSDIKGGTLGLDKVVLTGVETVGSNSQKISWNKVDNATGYTLYKSNSANGAYSWAATIEGGNNLEVTIKGLSNGTYYYKVWAFAGPINGNRLFGEFSDPMSGTLGLGKTEITDIDITGSNTASIHWNKVPGADGYTLYKSSSENGTYQWMATITGGDTLSYNLYNQQSGSTTYYKMWAWSGDVNGSRQFGPYSDVKAFTMSLGKVNLTEAQAVNSTTHRLTWDAVDKADGYTVYASTSENGTYAWKATVTGGDVTTYDLSGTYTKGQTYYYKVWAWAGDVNTSRMFGQYSDVKSITAK